ncbi:MAG: D-amino acid aminotransferase [Steroidobacteraceae bacterium]|nr:D-amino acid aminotransferase [Steroidobacteraceae bacterium]
MAGTLPNAWLDGRLVPLAEARVPALDRSFLFGDGIYEVMPVFDGKAYRLAEHLDRLERSLRELRIPNPHTRDEWRRICGALIHTNGGGDQYLYLQVSRGVGIGRSHLPEPGLVPLVFGFAAPLPQPGAAQLEAGMACVTIEDPRWTRCDIKSTALLGNVMAKMQAQDAGAVEAILLREGRVIEAGSSTVLVVRDGRVATPPDAHERLPGTTREVVLELARREGIAVDIREIAAAELRSADEIWLTAAVMGLRAVTRLDGQPVGNGVAGPLCRRLQALFESTRGEFCTECEA